MRLPCEMRIAALSLLIPMLEYFQFRGAHFRGFPPFMTTHQDLARINRYRSQSLRLLESAVSELRGGRWTRTEELLWGSLTLAVKGAAVSRGDALDDDAAVKAYARQLGSGTGGSGIPLNSLRPSAKPWNGPENHAVGWRVSSEPLTTSVGQ